MDNLSYFNRLRGRYERYYDVYADLQGTVYEGMDLLSIYSIVNSRSMFTRDLKVHVIEEYEYSLVRMYEEQVDADMVKEFADRIVGHIDDLVHPTEYHKKSIMTGVIITDRGATADAATAVKKFRYKRSFKHQLWGWCEVRLILVDLAAMQITHNVTGFTFKKQVDQFYKFPTEEALALDA